MKVMLRNIILGMSVAALAVGAFAGAPVAQESADGDRGEMQLSLEEAIRTTVERNLAVQVENYNFRESGYAFRSEYGRFDMEAFAELQTASTERPLAATIGSSESEQTIANLGVRQVLPTGGNYTLSFNNNRQSNNARVSLVNPAYNSDFGFNFNQPLLRDFGIDVNRRGIRIARTNLDISREDFRAQILDTVYLVEQAYYDLVFARENLEVKRQSQGLARDQERITQIRIDVGASAPLDILQPRVAIANRETEVITAEAQVRDAEDRLRRLMNLPVTEWDRRIIPTDAAGYRPMSVDQQAAVARAMELRPEVKQASLARDIRKINYSFARNQVLPSVDFNINYGFAGLGGTTLRLDDSGDPVLDPVTGEPITISGGYGDAFEQVYGFDNPSWSVGFNIGVPVSNIGARSEKKRAELDLQSSEVTENDLRQQIMVEVRKAARDIDTLAKQIAATRQAREAAERNVEAERKRYENGMTTNFNVLLIQQELSDARSNELLALVRYNQAIANYHRAVGDLLEVHNITVVEPEKFNYNRDRYEDVKWLNFEKNEEAEKK